MSRWNLAWLIGIPAVAIVGLTIAFTAPSREKDQNYELVRLLVEALDEVQHNYVRDLDPEARRKLVEDMINGGLERLDPYSAYMNPKEFKQFTSQSRGNFGGIGIQISVDRKSGYLQVVSPMVGTPAYEAGILAGDLVMKIEGKSTENMRIDEAVELIQGEPGQKITLSVLHEGGKEPVDVAMNRAIIEVPSVMGDLRKTDNPKEWDLLIDKDNKIGYVRLLVFNDNTIKELKAAIDQLKREGMRALVLDLRNNPGGQLESAREVSNCFLSDGPIVTIKGRNEKPRILTADASGMVLAPEEPVAVLVNRYSASASEIVSAALQDHERAVIVGERTYGKGSVQNILKMESAASALRLTTASYWRPSGKNIHKFTESKETDEWGVMPSPGFEVKLSDEERVEYAVYRRDRDIVHGKNGANPPPKPKASEEDKPKKPFVDRVLEKALEHLRAEVAKKK